VDDGVKGFREPVTENPTLNSTEIWEIYNETVDAHPIHLHLVTMQLINRQKFNAKIDEENGKPTNIRLIGQPQNPAPDEQGWKDTWVMNPGEVTRVIAKFDRPGLYVWHCHILSHEEHDMMRPFYVGTLPDNLTRNKKLVPVASELESELQLKAIPNPFSSYVMLQFNLTERKKLSIKLYNSTGNLVKQVCDDYRSAGLQRFMIDGSDLPSGVYFAEIIVNDEKIFRKLVLQK
jgi:spore coat protein A